MRKYVLISLLFCLGCGLVSIKQDTETVLIQTTAYTIAIQIVRQDPKIIPQAKAYCIALIQSDDDNLAPLFETAIKSLDDRYKDKIIVGNIKYLAGLIKTGDKINYAKVRIAAKAFLDGMSL